MMMSCSMACLMMVLLVLSGDCESSELSCEMLIAIDEPLFVHLGSDMRRASELASDLVARMNSLYANTLFRYSSDSGVYFRVGEVRVLFDFCTHCNATQIVYLSEFSKIDFSDFCLAHVFTYRDFPEGVQGLAWKSTICHRTYNTGFTTLLNHKVTSSRADSAMTFAHEVGHNLGAEHDETAGCASNYIMSESGSYQTNPQFSACSSDAILGHLRSLVADPLQNCLKSIPRSEPERFSFCGDGVVEGREECDCGLHYETCDDPCCYSAHITYSDYFANASATPCRRNRRAICVHPYQSVLMFGLVIPWIVIIVATCLISILLLYDFTNEKRCFGHLRKSKEGSMRSEMEGKMPNTLDASMLTPFTTTSSSTTTSFTRRLRSWLPNGVTSSKESEGPQRARVEVGAQRGRVDREARLLPSSRELASSLGPPRVHRLRGAEHERLRAADISAPSNLVSTAACVKKPDALRPVINATSNVASKVTHMNRTPNSGHGDPSSQMSVRTPFVKPVSKRNFESSNSNSSSKSTFPPDLDLSTEQGRAKISIGELRSRFESGPRQ